jgi:hypothetical protein
LKQQIRASGHPVMENYPARWYPEACRECLCH